MGLLTGAVIGSLVLGAGSMVQQNQAAHKAEKAQRDAEMESRRIAASQKPMEESATLLTDTGMGENTLGSLGLMVDPTAPKKKQTTGLSSSGSTGLATTASTSLGFGS